MLDGVTVPLTKFCITAESKLSLYMFSICQHEGRWHSGSAWRVTRRKRNSWYKCFTVQVFVVCSNSISHIQLFRERLSGKVHATILKGIVCGFEFSVFQRNLKQLARKAMEMCLPVLKESNKSRLDSYSRQEQCIDHIPYYLSGLSRAHFFPQPFSK